MIYLIHESCSEIDGLITLEGTNALVVNQISGRLSDDLLVKFSDYTGITSVLDFISAPYKSIIGAPGVANGNILLFESDDRKLISWEDFQTLNSKHRRFDDAREKLEAELDNKEPIGADM